MALTKVKLISDGVIVQGNLHSSHGITTAHIAEGTSSDSGLYYTNARVDSRITAASTSDLSEGTNLYYTDARADARVALIVDSSPATLNTLNELAAALGDDPNFATTTATSIGTKMPLVGGTFTGDVYILKTLNSAVTSKVTNLNTGSGSQARFVAVSDGGNIQLKSVSIANTTYGAGDAGVINCDTMSGGFRIAHNDVTKYTLAFNGENTWTGGGTFGGNIGIGVAAHATASLNITNTNQHIRLNNGSELGVITLLSTGELDLWAHGTGETINFRTGTGSGSIAMNVVGDTVGIGAISPDRTLDVRGTGLSIYGSGDNTELMLRGQVEGTGTVRNVGAWHWSIRSDVGGNNDDLKLLRFNTGTYAGTAMQIRSDNGGVAIGLGNEGYASQILSVKSGAADNVFYGQSTDANCFASFRDSNSTANIEFGAIGNSHVFRNDTTEKMRIDGSGKIIIPAIANGIKFEITSSAGSGHSIIEMGQVGSDGFLDVSAAGGGIVTHLSGYTGYASYFLSTVGVGTTSPSSYDAEGDDLVIYNAVTPGITIALPQTTAAGSARGSILFSDGTSGNEKYRGGVIYDHGTGMGGVADTMYLRAAVNSYLALDALGNVGIGTKIPPSDHRLQIHNAGAAYSRFALTNSSTGVASGDGLIFQMETLNSIIKNQENGSLAFGTNGRETDLFINSSGTGGASYVGISNTGGVGARTKLGVSFNVGGSAANLAESVTYATMEMYPYRTGSTYGMFFGNKGTAAGYIQTANGAGNDKGDIHINPFGGSVGIGVGNTSAGALLDVVAPNSGGATRQDMFRLLQSGQNTLSCYMYGGSTDLVQLHVSGAEQHLSLTTGGVATATTATGVHIRSGGNVGVGTLSPERTLHVAGKAIVGQTANYSSNAGMMHVYGDNSENSGILDIAMNGNGRYYTRVCWNKTSVSTAGYWHIKTNVPIGGNVMFMAKFYGYIYGSAQVLDLTHAGYAYSGTNTVINQGVQNNGNNTNASSAYYTSASGSKLCFRVAFGAGATFSTYFAGVFMDMAFPSPAGAAFDFEIEAQSFSQSTTVY